MTTPQITLVNASAGTGKTYRLTEAFLEAAVDEVEPERIVATTFTNKAAGELLERVRQRLLDAGRSDLALAALSSRVGTVHSILGSLIAEFAFDIGRSPVADVIPEQDAARLFRMATGAVLGEIGERIDSPAARLSLAGAGSGRRQDTEWAQVVRNLCDHARTNDIDPTNLLQFAEASWTSLRRLLPESTATAEDLDRALHDAMRTAVQSISTSGDHTKKTADALPRLQGALSRFDAGQYPTWAEWAALTKLDVAKASTAAVAPVLAAAGRHPAHPRLHEDLHILIFDIFAAAGRALDQYDRYKRERGLVDFVDQEHAGLRLLQTPGLRSALAEAIEVVLVDEFQDTSPIQLAVFLELAHIARRSIWVGDPKQAIFGFRGTDPDLVRAVADTVVNGKPDGYEQLDTSYRSRPTLVHFGNAFFQRTFPATGIPAEAVAIAKVERTDDPAQGSALSVWNLMGGNWKDAIAGLADGVNRLLRGAAQPIIVPRDKSAPRPARASDVAILCRANDRCDAVAQALAARSIPVAIARAGLLDTEEAGFAVAALRYLVDPTDTLAAAEIAHLLWDRAEQPGWFTLAMTQDGLRQLIEQTPGLAALNTARARLADLTPSETFDLALSESGCLNHIRRWRDPQQCLSNVDALRLLAAQYEDTCQAVRGAATATGLIQYLRTADDDAGQPASTGTNAVRVMTYHAAKGLEWPIVILMDLDPSDRATPFGLHVEPPAQGFDAWHPLQGRCLRYWPWPYGEQRSGVHLNDAAADTTEMHAAKRRAVGERLRLLYVGVTRARDYLVLARRPKGTTLFEQSADTSAEPVCRFEPGSPGRIVVGSESFPAEFNDLVRPETIETAVSTEIPMHGAPLVGTARISHPPLRLAPSQIGRSAADNWTVATTFDLGPRLPLIGSPDMERVGEAVHTFLAADNPTSATTDRNAMAHRILTSWIVTALQPGQLLEASDRLHRFLSQKWSGARIHREWPVHGRIGLQRASGRLDILVETDDSYIIIDHKTYPGRPETWPDRALEYGPQLAAYSDLVAHATQQQVHRLLIHLPIVGKVLELRQPGSV